MQWTEWPRKYAVWWSLFIHLVSDILNYGIGCPLERGVIFYFIRYGGGCQ